jgi:pimeloyl-ACP methyl ester carboxylesterase
LRTVAVFLFLLLCSVAAPAADLSALDECALSHPRLSRVVNARCVDYQVPLDPARADGERIRLHVAVIPASGRNPRPDPLFFFAGGPGQSAVDSSLLMWPVFSQVLRHRDLVLIDQRGTGKSTPLICRSDNEMELAADDETLRRRTRKCLDALQEDVRFFTSRQAVADVEFVRKMLGYEQYNVMGVSYGTRVAQLVLREYPGRVRSIVLDGVLPPELVLGPEFADNLSASLQKLFFHCAADARCRKAFPRLEAEWRECLKLPLEEKRLMTLNHPRTGEKQELQASRQVLDMAVRLLSYASETRALLPLLIHDTVDGDWAPLLTQALQVAGSLEENMAEGMHNSVVCSEDVPYYRHIPSGDRRVLGHMMRQLQLICRYWSRGETFSDIHRPLQSDAPALLLSGELDPVTPVSYGEQALKQFRRGRHLVVPGQGHNVSPRGCVPELVADFLENLTLDEEKAACLQNTPRLPFFIDRLGPGA